MAAALLDGTIDEAQYQRVFTAIEQDRVDGLMLFPISLWHGSFATCGPILVGGSTEFWTTAQTPARLETGLVVKRFSRLSRQSSAFA
jgi:hypothetical protein